MEVKNKLKVMVGNKEHYFTFLQTPKIHDVINDGENFYEITMVTHKQTVTRKPTEEEYEKMNIPSTINTNQFHVSEIEVEPAETVIYAIKKKGL